MLILPQPWASQPQIATNANLAFVSQGLEWAWSGVSLIEAVKSAPLTLSGTGIAAAYNPVGRGLAFTGGASTGKLAGTITDTPTATLFVVVSNLNSASGGTGNNGRLISSFNGTGGQDIFVTDSANNYLSLNEYFTTTNGQYTLPVNFSASTPRVIGIAFYGVAGTAPRAWVDGVEISLTGTAGVGTLRAGGTTINVGARPDVTTRQLAGNVFGAAKFSNALSPAVIQRITQNPWQLFAFLPRKYFINSAASGTPTGTLATTNANDTLAASGTAVGFTGTLAKTNANDTLAGVGTQTNTGTVARTNANDTLAGVGFLSTTGTLATTNANDSLNASGSGPAAPQASGGSGGGSTQNSRPDFGMSGRKLYEDAPKKKAVDVAAKKAADAVIAKAQDLAKEKDALNALKEAQQREKQTKARLAKAAAMEAKVAEMEANLAILQDDEEVLQFFLKVLEH